MLLGWCFHSLQSQLRIDFVEDLPTVNKTPNLFKLQEETYHLMAEDYDEKYPSKPFPLKAFSEAVYQIRLNDDYTISSEDWGKKLQCMERYKMVICRQIKEKDETQTEWYFRHDKIQDFFMVQTFLDPDNEDRLLKHINDPRFRGVYFLLATMMPLEAAKNLREQLIQYAADTKDHTVSDTFIQLFRSREAIGVVDLAKPAHI